MFRLVARLLVLAVTAIALLSVGASTQKEDAAKAAADAPFFRYLLGRPAPSLVAFNPSTFVPDKRIEDHVAFRATVRDDLTAIRPAFDGLVLYAFDKDITPVVLEEAVKLRFRGVLLGVWDVTSETELKGVAGLAKDHKDDLAIAICIGNEGVNFNRYNPKQLKAGYNRVAELLGSLRPQIPLTTSEPFGQYGQESILNCGDFLAPNIHPAFDRRDLDAKGAAKFTRERALALAKVAGRPVFVKETGFPHGGDDAKQFSPERQKEFWAAYLNEGRVAKVADSDAWASYAAGFAAFDEPWKVAATKIPFEGSWGLLAIDRTPYPAFAVFRDARIADPAAARDGRMRAAHEHLIEQMDLWTKGTTIYDDVDSGGHCFFPSKHGDLDDLAMDSGCKVTPARGLTCCEMTYAPAGPKGWAAFAWTYPDRNFGKLPGRDITGARKLSGFIRGKNGGEIVELSLGGVNCEPDHDPKLPHKDAFHVVQRIKLTKTWQTFSLDLPQKTSLENVIGGFTCTFRKALSAEPISIYLDEVRFDDVQPDLPRVPRSFVPTADSKDDPIRNVGYPYDVAIEALYLLSLGDRDSLRRARLLANALVEAQINDRFYDDGRWRNGYSCGPLIDQATNKARLPSIYHKVKGVVYEDRFCASSDAGNISWTMIALLAAHAKLDAGKAKPPFPFLSASHRAGKWIEEHCRVDDALGGYSGGFEGWEKSAGHPNGPEKLGWRSVEHNVDLAVAFRKLADAIDGEEKKAWLDRSDHARRFVLKMWNPKCKHFWVGVRDKKGTINDDAIPEDVQTWALLALGHDPEFRAVVGWRGPGNMPTLLDWVEEHCREQGAGAAGYRFGDKGKGIWPEGCAHIAAAYRYAGYPQRADAILDDLVKLAPAKAGELGIPAAIGGDAETGFVKEFAPKVVDKWIYPNRQHLGATAWFLLAARGVNPYWLDGPPARNEKPK